MSELQHEPQPVGILDSERVLEWLQLELHVLVPKPQLAERLVDPSGGHCPCCCKEHWIHSWEMRP